MKYSGTRSSRTLVYGLTLSIFFSLHAAAHAAQKVFSGASDTSTWESDENWFPQGVPDASDSASMNNEGLDVLIANDFSVQSLIIGGKGNTRCTVGSYVYGTIAPANAGSDSIHVRKNGSLVFKGHGRLILRGPLRISKEAITTENSVMLWLE